MYLREKEIEVEEAGKVSTVELSAEQLRNLIPKIFGEEFKEKLEALSDEEVVEQYSKILTERKTEYDKHKGTRFTLAINDVNSESLINTIKDHLQTNKIKEAKLTSRPMFDETEGIFFDGVILEVNNKYYELVKPFIEELKKLEKVA